MELKEWARKCRDKLEKYRIDIHESQLAKEVKWSLEGIARDYLESFDLQELTAEEIVAKIESHYRDPMEIHNALKEFNNFRQLPNESMTTYNKRADTIFNAYNTAAQAAKKDGVLDFQTRTEAEMLSQYINGIINVNIASSLISCESLKKAQFLAVSNEAKLTNQDTSDSKRQRRDSPPVKRGRYRRQLPAEKIKELIALDKYCTFCRKVGHCEKTCWTSPNGMKKQGNDEAPGMERKHPRRP